ncbi:hypothetical protein K438DRAFT_1806817 [Mycena galopus ATCC 62051]|nr:hypothetical protein K438DRAFT_1806817 [Mycena galopus ATCC 62051]
MLGVWEGDEELVVLVLVTDGAREWWPWLCCSWPEAGRAGPATAALPPPFDVFLFNPPPAPVLGLGGGKNGPMLLFLGTPGPRFPPLVWCLSAPEPPPPPVAFVLMFTFIPAEAAAFIFPVLVLEARTPCLVPIPTRSALVFRLIPPLIPTRSVLVFRLIVPPRSVLALRDPPRSPPPEIVRFRSPRSLSRCSRSEASRYPSAPMRSRSRSECDPPSLARISAAGRTVIAHTSNGSVGDAAVRGVRPGNVLGLDAVFAFAFEMNADVACGIEGEVVRSVEEEEEDPAAEAEPEPEAEPDPEPDAEGPPYATLRSGVLERDFGFWRAELPDAYEEDPAAAYEELDPDAPACDEDAAACDEDPDGAAVGSGGSGSGRLLAGEGEGREESVPRRIGGGMGRARLTLARRLPLEVEAVLPESTGGGRVKVVLPTETVWSGGGGGGTGSGLAVDVDVVGGLHGPGAALLMGRRWVEWALRVGGGGWNGSDGGPSVPWWTTVQPPLLVVGYTAAIAMGVGGRVRLSCPAFLASRSWSSGGESCGE